MLQAMYIFFLISMAGLNKGVNGGCVTKDYTITCRNILPQVVPENISRVSVTDFIHDRINNDTFKHNGWETVNYLDVTVNNNVNFRLHDYNFYALKNLTSLGIHSSELTFSGNKNIFHGLQTLQCLNLSLCFRLTTTELLINLETQISLDSLILDQLSTFDAGEVIVDNASLEMISKLKIKKISFSGCNILYKGPIYIANLKYYLTDIDISNTTARARLDSSDSKQIIAALLKLKSFNMSLISPRFYSFHYWILAQDIINPRCNESFNDDWTYLYWKVERLEMNRVFHRHLIFNNSQMNLSDCIINIKSWHLRSNNIHYLNATVQWPKRLHLFEIDLSLNDLEYLSPFVFGSVLSLEKLHLAHNSLYLMANFVEFKYLFSTFKKLWYLDLSKNRLSWLPKTIFANTLNLTTLDLSYNQLSTISFEITHLIKLRFLNMENNRVHYITGADLSNLILFIQRTPMPANISFLHNPVVCSCESVRFITWLTAYVKSSEIQSYACLREGKMVSLDTDAVDESEFLCIRSTIIIASVSTCMAALGIISLVTAIVMYKKRKQRRAREKANFLEDFKKGLLQQKFLIFLSYSSEDEGNEICNIYEHLRDTLKENTGIEQEIICIGNRHFNLGFPIVDEILRCISESCVVAFIVSNHFCESHWCQNELREAYELKKPIILICKENVDITLMPPLMLKIFRQYTRAKLVTNEDGGKEIEPSYEQLANSILKLAAMHKE